jgi:hypothetical protein
MRIVGDTVREVTSVIANSLDLGQFKGIFKALSSKAAVKGRLFPVSILS